jgi:6-phosphogluconolactonase (cycloisomerase 2 family)
MSPAQKLPAVLLLVPVILLFSNCSSGNSQTTNGTTPGSGSPGSGSGSGSSSGSGSGSAGSGSNNVPGYAEGIGASGQTGPAKFLYANPLPGGGPFTADIQSNGTLVLKQGGSANNLNPMTMAIDPSGSNLFQVAQGFNGGTQGGLFVYAINRTNGTLGTAIGSYMTGQQLSADVVDNHGKFLYALGASGVYAFSINAGSLTPIAGSPYSTPGPSSPGYSQPATLMVVDQTDKYLYVSTSGGIEGFSINQSTGQLTPVPGSPFGTGIQSPWTEVITPNNSFLYLLSSKSSSSIYGFTVDGNSGALTSLPGSPFSAGTCGTVTPGGTIGIPGPDNMTIATAGKFMYDNCGVYSVDETSGAITQVSGQGPGDWPVIDPTGQYLWAITSNQTACFSCTVGVQAYTVDANTGAFTPISNGFLLLTDTEVGDINSLAITN